VKKIRRALGLAIQLLASAGLMWLLLSRVGIQEVASRLAVQNHAAALAALLLLAAQLVAGTLRWRMVCTALGVDIPALRTALGWMGMGFALSQVLPSSIGGDGYRILVLGRRSGLGAATRSVVAERVAALLTLAALALPMSLAAMFFVPSPLPFTVLAVVSAAILVGGALAGVVTRLLARWTASRLVQLVAADFATMYSRATLLPVFGISVVIHLLSMSIVAVLSGALALDGVLWWQAALVTPGTVLATSIPVSLGGWGVRESSMVFSLAAFGVPGATALALSIGYGLAMAIGGAIGVLLWIASGYHGRMQSPPRPE